MEFVSAAALAALLATAAVAAEPADPSGTWKSTMGELKLTAKERKDDKGVVIARDVSGTYYDGKATLKGEIKGDVLTGYWVEPDGGHQCGKPRDGSDAWGRVVFTFKGDHFEGRWQNCDVAPDQAWNGDKVG